MRISWVFKYSARGVCLSKVYFLKLLAQLWSKIKLGLEALWDCFTSQHSTINCIYNTAPPFILPLVMLFILFISLTFVMLPAVKQLGNTGVAGQLFGEVAATWGPLETTSISFTALSTVLPKPTGGKKSTSTVPGRISLKDGSLRRSLPNRVGWLGYWVRM